MRHKISWFCGMLAIFGLGSAIIAAPARAADLDYGKLGTPVHLVVGYQPYDSEAWSAVVLNGLQLWKKYLPPGSAVEFQQALQGSIIVNNMLAGKQSIGYFGDMPAIVGATKTNVAPLRIVAAISLSHDLCNILFVSNNAPQFPNGKAAAAWLSGKTVAAPKGSCSDRFARAVFEKMGVQPQAYLNQNIELITSGFRANKLDAAIVWEPIASQLVEEGLARRVATGNDFDEPDGNFIDMRADLIQQRPDVAKAWLEAELAAEQYIGDPKNTAEIVKLAEQQTTGISAHALWQSLFGTYNAAQGGSSLREYLPFGFSDSTLELIRKDTAFLYSTKVIAVPQLPAGAIDPLLTDEILQEHGLKAPAVELNAQPESAFK
jgi:NitT/TauT family transport system substrate-binding protein